MTKLTFDAIVVGAGPAGTSAAITMAKSGLKVILIERGRFAGSKNLFGGVLYTEAIKEVLPDFAKRIPSPPFERPVTEQGYWLLSPDSVVRFMHKSESYKKEPADAYISLRAKFDEWYAAQAVAAGALLITKTTVTDFIKDEKGRVVGVQTDRPEGDVYANRGAERGREQPVGPKAGAGKDGFAAAPRGALGQGSHRAASAAN